MSEWGLRLTAAVLGPFLGTFIATFAATWPRLPRPLVGVSRCGRCGAKIAYTAMIPIVSYLSRRGKRGCCPGSIPRVYLLGELGGAVVGCAAAVQPDTATGALVLGVGAALLFAGLVDLRRYSIPWASIVGLAAMLVAAMASGWLADPVAHLATAAVVLVGLAGVRWFGSSQGRPGIAWGDVLLASLICAFVGPILAWAVVAAAAVLALGVQSLRRSSSPAPFGAYLAVSGFLFIAAQGMG